MGKYQHTDFDINFNKNSFIGDVVVKKDRNSIRQSIMNIVLTRKGEKPFNRNFGVGIHDWLFEQWTALDGAKLERDIIYAVRAYESRAEVVKVIIDDKNIDRNELRLQIDFMIFAGKESNPIADSIQIGIVKVR